MLFGIIELVEGAGGQLADGAERRPRAQRSIRQRGCAICQGRKDDMAQRWARARKAGPPALWSTSSSDWEGKRWLAGIARWSAARSSRSEPPSGAGGADLDLG